LTRGWALWTVCVVLAGCTGKVEVAAPDQADLVVASSHPEDMLRFLTKEFRERTGLRVTLIRAGTGTLLGRLGDHTLAADVMLGGGLESLEAAKDLFEPYLSGEVAAIPPEFRSAEDLWTGFSVLSLLIVYNHRLVPPEAAPRGWGDLTGPRFAGVIAFADPRQSGSAYSLLRVFRSLPQPEGLMERFVTNLRGRPLLDSAQIVGAVSSGEFLVGLTFESSDPSPDVSLVYPREGTLVLPDGVALVRGAPHPEAARRFIDFALGPDVASVLVGRYHRRSVRTEAPDPEGLPDLGHVKPLPYDIGLAAREKDETLARFTALWSQP